MKKFIPIISMVGISALIVGCSNINMEPNHNNIIKENLSSFQSNVEGYSLLNEKSLSKEKLQKYKLMLSTPIDATLVNGETSLDSTPNDNNSNVLSNEQNNAQDTENNTNNPVDNLFIDNTQSITSPSPDDAPTDKTINENNNPTDNEINTKIANNSINENITNNTPDTTKQDNLSNEDNTKQDNLGNQNNINNEDTANEQNDKIENIDKISQNKISTLYALTDDIDSSCDEFCQLKKQLTDAILETKTLIDKVQNNELSLNSEQKMFVVEQSNMLKNLGRELSNVTNELNFSLSDLGTYFTSSNEDVDKLNLKFLAILDNLASGNEMLTNGLYSLNMMNNLLNINNPNAQRRIIYGYKHNDEPAIIKDYSIDENGNVTENLNNDETSNTNLDENTANSNQDNNNKENNNTKSTGNIDTYKDSLLNGNIDSYHTDSRKNIDSFFNTALLDNEFMYGAGGYGYNNFNPYLPYQTQNLNYNNLQSNNNNPTSSVTNEQNTQDINNNNINSNNNRINDNANNYNKQTKKNNKSKFKLKSNIDTYRDKNTPTLSARFENIKKGFANFFSKFSKPNKGDKLKNPIHKFDE